MARNKTPNTRMVKQKKKRKLRKRVFFILIPLIVFLAAFGYAGYLYMEANSVLSDSYEEPSKEKSDLRDDVVDPDIDNVSVLIMGVDASDVRENDESSRTDALMLATLNKDSNSVNLLSIPRDSYVYIPEVGYESKINHAHAYGGSDAVVDTVENLLDIPVDYYVKVNFDAFVDVVDALDGITVDVLYEFQEQDSKDRANAIHLFEGEQKLNGEEALALARTRKLDNDIERGKRQQEIIKAILDKSISLNSILKYDDIIRAVGSNMTTNMLFSEIKSFISYGTSGDLSINTLSLEGTDYTPGSTYYWQLDEVALEETKKTLQEHLDFRSSSLTNGQKERRVETENASSAY